MGKIIDEYMDIKLQQECVSKTIDTLWKMAQKYQKIQEIMAKRPKDMINSNPTLRAISEVLEDGNEN